MTSSVPSKSIAELLQDAVQLHQAGHLLQAECVYDAVLEREPENGDALNLKGLISLDQGRIQEAISLLTRATTAAPLYPHAHFNLGNALAAAERLEEALGCYRKAISLDPSSASPHLNAGVLLEKLNRVADAVTAFRNMVHVCPSDPRGYRNLALCLVKAMNVATGDKRDEIAVDALAAFDRACVLDPANANAQFEYANFLTERGNHADAILHFEAALKLKPNWVEAISNLGDTLRKNERFEEAVVMQRSALALRPGDQIILTHLGNALAKNRAYDEAVEIFRELTAIYPDALLPRINLGNTYRERGRVDEAIAIFEETLYRMPDAFEAYGNIGMAFSEQGWFASGYVLNRRAVSIKGANPKVCLNQGLIALALGRFTEGWQEYELRFEVAEDHTPRRPPPPPYWRGENLAGKSILIWTEQGIGDEILYAEMIRDVIAQNTRCVITCSKRMEPIFARSFPGTLVIGYEGSAMGVRGGEKFDYQSSVASLGQYLRPDFAHFPSRPGYLKADANKAASLRARYTSLAAGRRIVGLSWRSNATDHGPAKSARLLDLAPLLTVKNIFFINLQYGNCADEIAEAREQLGVDVFQDSSVDPLKDMDAAFAQIAAMDLVVTTSNTTAHTAGAQNIPVWVMLPFGQGLLWYWFLRRQESVWYPSARLIRPPRLERERPWWHEVIDLTAGQLEAWVHSSG